MEITYVEGESFMIYNVFVESVNVFSFIIIPDEYYSTKFEFKDLQGYIDCIYIWSKFLESLNFGVNQ